MKNLLKKIFKRKPSKTDIALFSLSQGIQILENHMLAIARLQFIKPETLIREANNIEENSKYLKELINLKNNTEKKWYLNLYFLLFPLPCSLTWQAILINEKTR